MSLRYDNYAGFRLGCRQGARSPLALSGHAALALSLRGITPEMNRIQLSAACCCGQSGMYQIIGKMLLTAWSSLCDKVALAQLYKYHHLSGNAARGKPVWKQYLNYGMTLRSTYMSTLCNHASMKTGITTLNNLPFEICMAGHSETLLIPELQHVHRRKFLCPRRGHHQWVCWRLALVC